MLTGAGGGDVDFGDVLLVAVSDEEQGVVLWVECDEGFAIAEGGGAEGATGYAEGADVSQVSLLEPGGCPPCWGSQEEGDGKTGDESDYPFHVRLTP